MGRSTSRFARWRPLRGHRACHPYLYTAIDGSVTVNRKGMTMAQALSSARPLALEYGVRDDEQAEAGPAPSTEWLLSLGRSGRQLARTLRQLINMQTW